MLAGFPLSAGYRDTMGCMGFPLPDLQAKHVLITGGSRRIGRAIALAFAGSGAHVAITYQSSGEAAGKTVEELRSFGGEAVAVACDLHDPQGIDTAIAEVVERFGGRLDVLVNNAGSFETADPENVTPEQWDAMFAINTRAPMLVAQAALPYLREAQDRGRIINIGSLGGLRPWATHAHYCASKAALHMLTQTMAKAWAPQVAVNCVAPGMIVTGAEADPAYAHFAKKTPMQRNGATADVAELVMFLASCTPFLTGQVIAMDGGLSL